MDWQIAGVILAALGLMVAWMNRKFDNIDNHVMEAHKRIDQTNCRLDEMLTTVHQRIDQTQAILMKMSEKQSK